MLVRQEPRGKSISRACPIFLCLISQFPERIYPTPSPVSALDFANERSNLLGVGTCYVAHLKLPGLSDGNIFVFDVCSPDAKPVLDSRFVPHFSIQRLSSRDKPSSTKHSHPIWNLKWVIRERMIVSALVYWSNLRRERSAARCFSLCRQMGVSCSGLCIAG